MQQTEFFSWEHRTTANSAAHCARNGGVNTEAGPRSSPGTARTGLLKTPLLVRDDEHGWRSGVNRARAWDIL